MKREWLLVQRKRTYVVGSADDLPPGSVTVVPVGKFGVGVFNIDGRYYALTNFCPHRGGPMCRGAVTGLPVAGHRPYEIQWEREGEILVCPWHGWEFDMVTGRAVAYPDRRIKCYPVVVEDNVVKVVGV